MAARKTKAETRASLKDMIDVDVKRRKRSVGRVSSEVIYKVKINMFLGGWRWTGWVDFDGWHRAFYRQTLCKNRIVEFRPHDPVLQYSSHPHEKQVAFQSLMPLLLMRIHTVLLPCDAWMVGLLFNHFTVD